MSTIKAINIRPEVSILSILKSVNYKPWYAIAEFVDNAVQSYQTYRTELSQMEGDLYQFSVNIDIDLSDGNEKIEVRDNAAGIHASEFVRAFRPAAIPDNRNGLSEFGMGMKSAACWFANFWEVRTTALGESVERVVEFDVDAIVKNKVETIEISERPARPESHFTCITLRQLNQRPQGRTLGKIRDHLADLYRVFLRSGLLALTLNGETISFTDPKILTAPHYKAQRETVEWRKKIDLEIAPGMRIFGFAALLDKGQTSGAGFALLRRNRVIVGSDDEGYRPAVIFGKPNSFVYQRLFGELHLEGFGVSHTKDGIQWDHHEELVLQHLKTELNREPLPLIDQALNYRARTKQPSPILASDPPKLSVPVSIQSVDAVSSTRTDSKILPEPSIVRNPTVAPPVPLLPPTQRREQASTTEQAKQQHSKKINIKLNDATWEILVVYLFDPAITDWFTISSVDYETRKMGVGLSLVHPFSVQYQVDSEANISLITRIVAVMALSEIAAQGVGIKQSGVFRKSINRLVREGFVD